MASPPRFQLIEYPILLIFLVLHIRGLYMKKYFPMAGGIIPILIINYFL